MEKYYKLMQEKDIISISLDYISPFFEFIRGLYKGLKHDPLEEIYKGVDKNGGLD